MAHPTQSLALALSGGGVRAMVFHLGVLKSLAERGLLERVNRLSTVSGGTLVTGLIYQTNAFEWPDSAHFLEETYPRLRERLCTHSMQLGAAKQLLHPGNWRHLLSRANLLAGELKEHWGIDAPLSRIPARPAWSINGTTAETGKRFRFKDGEIGDWQSGYAAAPDLPLSDAMAVSAAFPVGLGPLALRTGGLIWRKRTSWNAPPEETQTVSMPWATLHLYDGGVYDNLGQEAFFDPGRQTAKYPDEYILVSDAGAPMTPGFSLGPLNPFRIQRIMDVMLTQTRDLRIRAFSHYLQTHPHAGAMALIGVLVPELGEQEKNFVCAYPTSLKQVSRDDFDRLARYGHAVAQRAVRF